VIVAFNIGPEELRRIAEVKAYAAAHVWDATQQPYPPEPGENPAHVLMLGIIRVVYSHTLASCTKRERHTHLFHHLSISVFGKLPMRWMVGSVAEMFEIDLDDPQTVLGVNKQSEGYAHDYVVVMREIGGTGKC